MAIGVCGGLIRAAAMFAAKGDVRAYLNAVHVERRDGRVSVTASDGHTAFLALVSYAQDGDDERFAIPVGVAAKVPDEGVSVAGDRVGAVLVDATATDDRVLREMIERLIPADRVDGFAASLDARYIERVGKAFALLAKGAKYGAPVRCSVATKGPAVNAHVFRSSRELRGADVTALVMPMRD